MEGAIWPGVSISGSLRNVDAYAARVISDTSSAHEKSDGGAPVNAVKEMMSHVDISTAMRYVHVTDAGKRRAVEAAVVRRAKEPATNLPQKLERTARSDPEIIHSNGYGGVAQVVRAWDS
jgi:hypothetical protein